MNKNKIIPLTITLTMLLFLVIPCVVAQDTTPSPIPVGEPLHNDIVIGLAITFFFVIFNTLFILIKPPSFEITVLTLLVMLFTIMIGTVIVIPINQTIGIFMIVYSVFVFIINVLRVQI